MNIRLNAVITGIFLAIELAALAAVTVLGITHAKNWSSLLHPVVGNSHGGLTSVSFTAVLALTAVAVFSYNGYANAVNFSEETTGSSRRIARAILLALVITVAAELIPVTATIVGSPSIAKLSTSAVPMQYFIEATSNKTVYTVISVGVVIAILNAVIAIVLSYGRIFFSSGRDRAWPGPVSSWMILKSSRFRSPWFATAVIGILGAVMCLTVSLNTLVNLTGASLVADYALIAIAALFARPTGATAHSPYKMPFWPLPPILALLCLGYIFTKQTSLLLWVTLITIGIGLVYWLVVIFPSAAGPGRCGTLSSMRPLARTANSVAPGDLPDSPGQDPGGDRPPSRRAGPLSPQHSETPSGRPRARALGIPFDGTPGPWNAITDVPGVEVGYETLVRGASVRTGVTAHPPARPGRRRRPGDRRVLQPERQRRDDRDGLDPGVRHVLRPGGDHQHARRRRGARGHRGLDGAAPPAAGRRLAAAGGRRDLGRLPERHQRRPRHPADRD